MSRREFIHSSLKSNFSLKVYTVNAQFSGIFYSSSLFKRLVPYFRHGPYMQEDNYNHEFQSKKSGL